jgi:hypothetical protein
MKVRASLFFLIFAVFCASAATVGEFADKVAPLIDPAKLATLKTRGANPRVQKIVFWLATARTN